MEDRQQKRRLLCGPSTLVISTSVPEMVTVHTSTGQDRPRKPDVDLRALGALVARAVPGVDRATLARTAEGVSTQVYRIEQNGRTLYVRVAEERDASLTPEAVVHDLLRARGVLVPEVVHFEPFADTLERSVMVTTEIAGTSLAHRHTGVDVCSVLMAAGRDLAVINEVGVAGFGWIRRDGGIGRRLMAE